MRARTVVVRIRLGGLGRSSKVCIAERKNTPRAAGLLLLTASLHARQLSVAQDCVLPGAGAERGTSSAPCSGDLECVATPVTERALAGWCAGRRADVTALVPVASLGVSSCPSGGHMVA